MHSVYENKNSLQATIIPDIYLCNKNEVFVTFDFHTLKKLNFFFTTNLDQQISGCSDIT